MWLYLCLQNAQLSFFHVVLILLLVIYTLAVLVWCDTSISEKLSAVVSLQVPPSSIFDWAESSNGLGLDWHHSQSFQLDLCGRYLCSYIHPEVLARVRKSKETLYEWFRPPLPLAEGKRNNHESLNNWEIHHKKFFGRYTRHLCSEIFRLLGTSVSWQPLWMKIQMASLLCPAGFSTVNVNSTSMCLLA